MKFLKNQNPFFLLALIVLLAFSLRVARALIETRVDKDAVVYVQMAKELASGNINDAFGYIPRLPPLYVSIMAAGEYLGIGAEKTGLILSIFAGTLLIIPVFWIAFMLSDNKYIALVAALLAATHPYLVRDGAEVLRDSLFYCLVFTGLAFAVRSAEKIRPFYWLMAGLFTGLATLTRSEGNELLIAAILWIIWEFFIKWKKRALNIDTIKNYLMAFLCLLTGFMLVTAPVQICLSKTSSTWCFIDQRIISYGKAFVSLPKADIINAEEH